MKDQRWADLLNRALSSCCRTRRGGPVLSGVKRRVFFPSRVDVIGPENVRTFDDVMSAIAESEEGSTASDKALLDLLLATISPHLGSDKVFNWSDGRAFKETIESWPMQDHRVVREVYGVEMPPGCKPLSIGCFILYEWARHSHLIVGTDVGEDALLWERRTHGVLIECCVSARDAKKARELANMLFHRFELAMRFIIPHRDARYDVRILEHRPHKREVNYVFYDSSISVENAQMNPTRVLKLDESPFDDTEPVLSRIFRVMGGGSANSPLEETVFRSVEWIGEAIDEKNRASAFVKAVTALEIIFGAQRDTSKNLSERCAYLLARSVDEAVRLETEARTFYDVRSKVVHGGMHSVSKSQLDDVIELAANVVRGVLADPYSECLSAHDVIKRLNRRRYAGLECLGSEASVSEMRPASNAESLPS